MGTQSSLTQKFPLTEKTYQTENLSWRVLGVSENGRLEIVSENPMSEQNKVFLANGEGFLYAQSNENEKGTLDTMCNNLYGYGYGAESARSLNVEDVNKLAGIITEQDKKALNSDYGNKIKYRIAEDRSLHFFIEYNLNTGSGYSNTWTEMMNIFASRIEIPGVNEWIKDGDYYYSPELTNELYYYNVHDKINKTAIDGKSIADLISKGTTNNIIKQFLASKFINFQGDSVWYRIRELDRALVESSYWLFESGPYNYYYCQACRIRPVVTLKYDIKLSGSSQSGWTIET